MCHFRLANILLPAYSRHHAALCGAGLLTEADDLENHELEQLVLRERGVVWADQEGAGQSVKRGAAGENALEATEAGRVGQSFELAPVLSFSQLLYLQSSPCSKSPHTQAHLCLSRL